MCTYNIDQIKIDVKKSNKTIKQLEFDKDYLLSQLESINLLLKKKRTVEIYNKLNNDQKLQWKLYDTHKLKLMEKAIVNGVQNYNCVIFEENSKLLKNTYEIKDNNGKVRNFAGLGFKTLDAFNYIEQYRNNDLLIFFLFED
jgi:hypothetical protein